jgi:plastocyanin
MYKYSFLLFAFLIIIFTSCKKEKPTSPNEVYIINSAFDPASITITKGTTLTWTNKESITHSVTSDSLIFNSGDMSKDQTFSYTFNTIGTYPYRCIYHNNMKGKVIVQ